MELRQKAAHWMDLSWKLGSGPLASPQVHLIPCETFQRDIFRRAFSFLSLITIHSLSTVCNEKS